MYQRYSVEYSKLHPFKSIKSEFLPISCSDNYNIGQYAFSHKLSTYWDWPRLLQEFQRVTRSGGVIRLTECDTASPSNSAAQQRLSQVMVQTLYRAGHLFNEKSDSVMQELAPLLTRYGLRNVQSRFYKLAEYSRGSVEWENGTENLRLLFKTLIPFFRKWGQLPDDYDATYQQMLSDIEQPGYASSWTVLTAWGNVR